MPNLTLTPKTQKATGEITLTLTKKTISNIPAPDPSGKQTLHWHPAVPGFGVLASGKTASKSYIVQKRLPSGKTVRITLGNTEVLSVNEALEEGRRHLVTMSGPEAKNPKAEQKKAQDRDKTLEQWFAEFLKARAKKNMKDTTKQHYSHMVNVHLKKWLNIPLREITGSMVEERHAELGRDVGKATANVTFKVLRAIFNYALRKADEGILPANPCGRLIDDGWFSVPARTRKVRADQLPQFYRAIDQLENSTAADYVKLLLFTGLRRNEAAGLKWDEDIDLPNGIIRIPATRTKTSTKLDLPMSTFVRDLLVKRRGSKEGEMVFPADSVSGHITQTRFVFEKIAEICHIRVSAHDMRRTYATFANNAGVNGYMLKALLNHSMGKGVTEGYLQPETEDLRESAQKICDRLIKLCEIEQPEGVTRLEQRA